MRPIENLEVSEMAILCRAHSSFGSGRKVGQTKPWLSESRVEICQTKDKMTKTKKIIMIKKELK